MIDHNVTKRVDRARRLSWVLVGSILLSGVAVAQSEKAWVQKARTLFENDEYQAVIELVEPYRKDTVGAMFLTFSYLQESIFNGTRYDKEMYKQFKLQVEAKITADQIPDLLYFVDLADKPEVVKEARRLSAAAFKNISQIEDVPKLVTFLSSGDEGARKLALSSIKRIIEPKRDYVEKGGTLRAKDIQVMGSPRLIVPLLDRLSEKDAFRTLVLIEEPVLTHLPRYEGPNYTELDVEINKAIAERREKYPQSNWYSAVGKTRD
jgi:hypothetical protein